MDFENNLINNILSSPGNESDSNKKNFRNIKLTIQYDGTAFIGWQRQNQGKSIQFLIESALKKITGEDINIRASGRTDASVHAFCQIADFKTISKIPIKGIKNALNSLLPGDISIIHIEQAEEDFHSIAKSIGKCYIYRIIETQERLPLFRRFCWEINKKLDINVMGESIRHIIGKHDFSAFKASGSSVKHSVREVIYFKIFQKKRDFFFPLPDEAREIDFIIIANGFLRKMVRNIVGLLVEAGLGRITPEKIMFIIEGLDRNAGYPTAPPQGLFLFRVFYDNLTLENFINKTDKEILTTTFNT